MRTQTRRVPVTTISSLFVAVALAGVATMVASGTVRAQAVERRAVGARRVSAEAGAAARSEAGGARLSEAGAATPASAAALSEVRALRSRWTGPAGSGSEADGSL